jgi:hypothetical protein
MENGRGYVEQEGEGVEGGRRRVRVTGFSTWTQRIDGISNGI